MHGDSIFGHAFNLIPNSNALKLEGLLNHFGSFENAWNADGAEIKKIIPDENYTRDFLDIRKKLKFEEEFEKINETGINVLSINDTAYPRLLREISHPPSILYFKGVLENDAENENSPRVAIVGTRRATHYGLESSNNLAFELSSLGISIVSGLALGIDSAAHRGALKGKAPTLAVLGSGLLKIYPLTNKGLADKIIENNGAVISEFAPNLEAKKWTFPQRNRIVAGLSKAIIVIEAPEKSGALITVRFALDANREVGAVPGEITSINSKGTNELLRNGAALIRNADDVLELIGETAMQKNMLLSIDNLDETENNILAYIKDAPQNTDDLIEKTGIEASELNQKITMLELKGIIKNKEGIFYKI